MTTVIVDRLPATLQNLNSSTLTATTYGNDDGLYALINDMISNLSSIKASVKAEEKKMHANLAQEIVIGTNIDPSTLTVDPATVTAATAVAVVTATRGDKFAIANAASGLVLTDVNVNVAVLISGTKKYSEAAVYTVLKPQAQVIRDLKAGTITDYTIATTADYNGPALKAPAS